MQAAAEALLPREEVALYAFSFPQDVQAYFAPDRRDPDALTPKIYAALKSALRRFGSEVFLISEQAVQEACAEVRARDSVAIALALDPSLQPGDRYEAAIRVAAGLAVALAAANPVRQALDVPGERPAANVYCALVIGLAVALASRADTAGQSAASLEEAADYAVHARLAELSAALESRAPAPALAVEFRDLLRFLP